MMQIEVVAAAVNQKPILANLLELYAHDFSEISDLHLDSDGHFGYEYLPLYWQESNCYPFLVKANGNLAGFVFVRKGSEVSGDENIWDLAEFFIVRGYRRHRIGMKAAHEIWEKFPGLWEVRVTQENTAAQAFWSQAVTSFMGLKVEACNKEIKGKTWNIFSFNTESRKVS